MVLVQSHLLPSLSNKVGQKALKSYAQFVVSAPDVLAAWTSLLDQSGVLDICPLFSLTRCFSV